MPPCHDVENHANRPLLTTCCPAYVWLCNLCACSSCDYAVSGPVLALLDDCPPGVWGKLHAVAGSAASTAEKEVLQVSMSKKR